MSPVRALLAKEWADVVRNRLLLAGMILPAVIFLLIPIGMMLLMPTMMKTDPTRAARELEGMTRLFQQDPSLKELNPQLLYLIFLLRQFLIMFLIVPVISSLSIATYSIIGEKQNRTLEPILATPITTVELLIGKTVAATLPSIVVLWLLFLLYVASLYFFTPAAVLTHVVNRVAVVLVFLIGPLIAVLGLSVGVIVSSRSTDPRSAQQIGAVLVLPLIVLLVSQLTGIFFLTLPFVLAAAAFLAVIDFFVFRAGVALFQREKILTQWK